VDQSQHEVDVLPPGLPKGSGQEEVAAERRFQTAVRSESNKAQSNSIG
jgi:hypothetical protein